MLRKRRKTVQDLEESESEEDLNISAVNSFENCIYASTIEKVLFSKWKSYLYPHVSGIFGKQHANLSTLGLFYDSVSMLAIQAFSVFLVFERKNHFIFTGRF